MRMIFVFGEVFFTARSSYLLTETGVERLAAYGEFARRHCLLFSGRAQDRLSASVFAFCSGNSYPFPLSFQNQGPFKFSHSAQHGQEKVRHRRVFTGQNQGLFDKLNGNPLFVRSLSERRR